MNESTDITPEPTTASGEPYAHAAPLYYAGGWHGVLPLPPGRKKSPPSGWTGHGAPYPSFADIHAWTDERPAGNVALRMPPDVLGIDVDAYGSKPGGRSFATLIEQLGPLPPTWTSTAREDEVSGIRFFRVSPGVRWTEKPAGPGIELIHAGHRYAVVWPSTNPHADGAPYVWIGPTGTRGVGAPRVHDLPELPHAWLEHLSAGEPRADPFAAPEPERSDPFATPSRVFTPAEARAYVITEYNAFKAMTDEDVNFNQRLNDLAIRVGHFVPAFFDEHTATEWLHEAAEHNGSVAYQGDRAVRATIASGLRAGYRDWRASRREPESEPSPVTPEATGDAVDALMAKMLDRDALDALPAPVFLIEDMLDMDSASWIIGQPGGFKSFVALDQALHVALGRPWRGKRVNGGRVIYMAAEGQKGIPQRVRAWEATYGERVTNIHFLPMPIQVSDRARWAVLVEACRRLGPAMVVLDTQARITVGLQENDATDMGHMVWAVDQLKAATGACVLVVHHTGRNGLDARGSSAIDGAQDTEIRVDRPSSQKERAKLTATIGLDKQKDGDEGAGSFDITMRVVDLGVDEASGRKLSSLALEPMSPFGDVAVKPEPDWIENLTENQAEVVRVMRVMTDEHGATMAQVLAWINEGRKHDKRTAMPKGSLQSALRALVAREPAVVVRKGAKVFLAECLDLD